MSDIVLNQRLHAVCQQHLILARKYERNGNAGGAAKLRNTANLLGLIIDLEFPVENIPTCLPDATDAELMPKPNGFAEYWKRRKSPARWLIENTVNGIDNAFEDCWVSAQAEALKKKE